MELVWEEVYENERKILGKGWQSCPKLKIDPPNFANKEFRRMPEPWTLLLPRSENAEYRWVWADDWQKSEWKYAVSFGASLRIGFKWSHNKSKIDCVRQRVWKRPRIRRVDGNKNEIKEYVIENQRRVSIGVKQKWLSPYLPGDRPHYSDENGKLKTKNDVERSLPPSWDWKTEWIIEKGDHCDENGWEYAIDFLAGLYSPTKNILLHNVRRRRWFRIRKTEGLLKQPKRLDIEKPKRKLSSQKKQGATTPCQPVRTLDIDPNENIKTIVVNVDVDDGWGTEQSDGNENQSDENETKGDNIKDVMQMTEPPFRIDICWQYEKVFRETRHHTSTEAQTLAVWKPILSHENKDENENSKSETDERQYFFGYLGLKYEIDPNYNIPSLLIKKGSDTNSFKEAENFRVCRFEQLKRKHPQGGKEINVYRYWLHIVAPAGYVALGSVVIEKYKERIPDKVIEHDLKLYLLQSEPQYYRHYGLNSIVCIKEEYLTGNSHFIDVFAESKQKNFAVYQQQALLVRGVYKMVEMPLVIRSKHFEMERENNSFLKENCQNNSGFHISYPILDKAIKVFLQGLRIVGDSPIIVSYAQHYNLAWSSKGLTDTSNTKCAVWEPVLSDNEYMVGHLALQTWEHPSSNENSSKLLIIKSGGSDPDAFKEPIGFECVWSARCLPTNLIENIANGVGKGFLTVGSGIVNTFQSGFNFVTTLNTQNNKDGKLDDSTSNKKYHTSMTPALSMNQNEGQSTKTNVNVGINTDMTPPGSFWRAIPPRGYVALGDIALPIDGDNIQQLEEFKKQQSKSNGNNNKNNDNGNNNNENKDKSKRRKSDDLDNVKRSSILLPHDVPRFVCVKKEYVTKIHELVTQDSMSLGSSISKSNTMLQHNVGSEIWSSKRNKNLRYHSRIFRQPPVTRDIVSPMFCTVGLRRPQTDDDIYPTLGVEFVIETLADVQVIKAGYIKKKGAQLMSGYSKRFFVLTNEKRLYYYDNCQLKSCVDLTQMTKIWIEASSKASKTFCLTTHGRKWVFECVNASQQDGPSNWVKYIEAVANGKYDNSNEFENDDNDSKVNASSSINNSENNDGQDSKANEASLFESAAQLAVREKTEEEWIDKLLSNTMDRFEKLLKENNQVNEGVETSESIHSILKWYEDIENTRDAFEILLSKWPLGTVTKPFVVRARSKLKELMEFSQNVILDDIKAYSSMALVSNNDAIVIRLNRACNIMSDLPKGKMMVCSYITSNLLLKATEVFRAGTEYGKLEQIDRRFVEYRRIMKDYDSNYECFIPKWWNLGIQIASQYCSLMGEQLDDQLTRFPQNHDIIVDSKSKCTEFEKELVQDSLKRIISLEIDVRSWTKNNSGDAFSWIQIDGRDYKLDGRGLHMVIVDLYKSKGENIFKQEQFDFYHAFKQNKVLNMLTYMDSVLNLMDSSQLLILACHETIGDVNITLSKELKSFGITQDKLPNVNKSSFVYIGRKDYHQADKFFVCQNSKDICHYRRIVKPYIADEYELNKLVTDDMRHSIPFYPGIISQVLERHLDTFVGQEAEHASMILENVISNENFDKLANDMWLERINNLNESSQAYLPSILDLTKAMEEGFKACLKVTHGKPLLQLLTKYGNITNEYAKLLYKLLNDILPPGTFNVAGMAPVNGTIPTPSTLGSTTASTVSDIMSPFSKLFKSNLMTNQNDNNNNNATTTTATSDNGGNESVRSNSSSGTVVKIASFQAWKPEKVQHFIIYACMIFNTCRKTRELVEKLEVLGKEELNAKFRGILNFDASKEIFLQLEEQILNVLRIVILNRFRLFEFSKHDNSWDTKKYASQLSLDLNVHFRNMKKLLNDTTFIWFMKLFSAYFALRLYEAFMDTKEIMTKLRTSDSGINDLPNLFEACMLHELPTKQASSMKILQSHVSKCMGLVSKIVEVSCAPAGDKYRQTDMGKSNKFFGNRNDGSHNSSSNSSPNKRTSNLFGKLFGGIGKDNAPQAQAAQAAQGQVQGQAHLPGQQPQATTQGGKNEEESMEEKEKNQLKYRTKTKIESTPFAKKAIEFYSESSFNLNVVNFVPKYVNIFGDDKEDSDNESNDDNDKGDASGGSGVTGQDSQSDALSVLDNLAFDKNSKNENDNGKNIDNNNNNENESSDDDDMYDDPGPHTKTTVGFAIVAQPKSKKKKKRKQGKKQFRTIADGKSPSTSSTGTGMKNNNNNDIKDEKKTQENREQIQKMDTSLLSMASMINQQGRLNEKWKIIKKIMELRGFDLMDQRTIQFMCEDCRN